MQHTWVAALLVVGSSAGCAKESAPAGNQPAADQPAADQPAADQPAAGTPAPAGVVDDACGVFTVEQLAAGLGFAVARSSTTHTPSTTADGLPLVQCLWEQGKGRFEDHVVDLAVHNFASGERAAQYVGTLRVTGESVSYADLPGIGDEAVALRGVVAKPTQASIAWRKGATVFQLGILRAAGLDPAAGEALLVKVADAAF